MKVSCSCGVAVNVRKGVVVFSRRGRIPTWRGRCQSCGLYWCGRGHRGDMGQDWLGDDGGGYICTQGECGEFKDAWSRLWRQFVPMERGASAPVVSAEKAEVVRKWILANPGAKADGYSDFLAQWAPRGGAVTFGEQAAQRRNEEARRVAEKKRLTMEKNRQRRSE